MTSEVNKLLEECGRLHGHICPGQLLGVRMGLLGCQLIGVREPRGADRKKIIVCVEIDRCLTDALGVVTGVSLGRRTLKFFDYGKVAATFLNTESGAAVRVVALDSARVLADSRYPELSIKKDRQMRAYAEADNVDLFKFESVELHLSNFDLPGHPRRRVVCEDCGEGINDGREVIRNDGVCCQRCAKGGYYCLPDRFTG